MDLKTMLKGMLETRDCLGLQEHKVLTLNTVYHYPIEEPKTKEMERLKDFAESCFREGWIHAVSIIQDSINEEEFFERIWAMPNKQTFTIKPIKELLLKEFKHANILDPFPFEYKEDATDFLNKIEDESHEYAVFDPPYSPRQLKECYGGKGEYDTKSSTWSKWKDLLASKIKEGGKVISFGWNSGGLGMKRGFKIKKILLVPHGGNHNDTICVVEEKCVIHKEKET